MKKEKSDKKVFYKQWWFWAPIIFFLFILSAFSQDTSSNNTLKNEQKNNIENQKTEDNDDNKKEEEKEVEKPFKCNDTYDYESEYNAVLKQLYPYGYKVHRFMDYTLVREEETSCLYKTSIKITTIYGTSADHTMYIGTNLDKQNKKETLKNIMVDNIYVYGEQ